MQRQQANIHNQMRPIYLSIYLSAIIHLESSILRAPLPWNILKVALIPTQLVVARVARPTVAFGGAGSTAIVGVGGVAFSQGNPWSKQAGKQAGQPRRKERGDTSRAGFNPSVVIQRRTYHHNHHRRHQ